MKHQLEPKQMDQQQTEKIRIAEDEEEVDPGFPMHLLPTASGGEDEMKL